MLLAQMNPTFIGLGSQTRSWISNLEDSGISSQVYLRPNSSSKKLINQKGYQPQRNLNAAKIIFLLIPDSEHLPFLQMHHKKISDGALIILAHGASVMEHKLPELFPKLNFALLAIKAIASEIRHQYTNQGKLGAVYSLEAVPSEQKDHFFSIISEISSKVGVTAGPFEVTFEQEAKADLFSEQSLLCGLLPYAAEQSYNILREQGIPKELAFMECWLEVKLIADAMVKMGPVDFFKLISPHALIGSEIARERIFDKEQQKNIEQMRQNIWSGEFFNQVNAEDLTQIKDRVTAHWSNGELQQTYQELKNELIPK